MRPQVKTGETLLLDPAGRKMPFVQQKSLLCTKAETTARMHQRVSLRRQYLPHKSLAAFWPGVSLVEAGRSCCFRRKIPLSEGLLNKLRMLLGGWTNWCN